MQRLKQIEPYWYVISLFLVASLALFIYHLQTGFVPDRVAITIPAFDLPIYWYGVLIIGGVGLGAYVVSRLGVERGERLFLRTVPLRIRRQPLSELSLPPEVEAILKQRDINTVGELLLPWGLDPDNLGLNRTGMSAVRERLRATPTIRSEWVTDPPWRQWSPDHVWNGVVWALILGIIGARLYHVLTPSPSMAEVGIYSPWDYFEHPLQLINLRRGGLGIYGGIAGGLLGLYFYTRRQGVSTLAWADLGAVGLALGQFIGRWGNFFNQELYGRPTDLPWGIWIEPIHRLSGFTQFSRFHPAFLYESLWNLLSFLVLYTLARHYRDRLFTGDLAALYLIFYAIGRTLLETVRLDSRPVTLVGLELNLAWATLVSLIIAAVMVLWLGWRHWRQA